MQFMQIPKSIVMSLIVVFLPSRREDVNASANSQTISRVLRAEENVEQIKRKAEMKTNDLWR